MKRSTCRLAGPVLAAALLLGVAAGPARAYFTASDSADGGIIIKQPDTDIREYVGDGQKKVVIYNKEDSVPVWVRAKVFAASEYNAEIIKGAGWSGPTANDWYTYDEIVDPGKTTKTSLDVKINWKFVKENVGEDDLPEGYYGSTVTVDDEGGEDGGTSQVVINRADGTNYNIVVVYEAQPVKYDESGKALPPTWPEN